VNGGLTSTVKVGNDKEYSLDKVVNPVPKTPKVVPPSTSTNTSVKTGDSLPVKAMTVLMIMSLIGMIFMTNHMLRKKKTDKE
ncbi:MAG: hypothetical protein IJ054_00925, partial [Lachnospiraceae bacterium]|nr:hypothetical protein [Lachnospiraceae bacterium]